MPSNDMESSSSGLIMSVIRVLTNSKDDAERDVIKKKIEDCLVVSDQKLTKLVSEHHKDLRLVMQAFTSISNNLQSSLVKLARAKQRLIDCKEILTSRIEELNRLSDESRINERIVVLLDQFEELSRIPMKINELIDERQYLTATKLLVEKQKYIDENIETFDCLKEIKSELESKRDELYKIFRERLFNPDNQVQKEEIIESLRLIDIIPELDPEIDAPREKPETSQVTKPSLFRFSSSSHAICFNEHYKEQIEVTKTLLSR